MIENEKEKNDDISKASNEESLKLIKETKKELAEYRKDFEKSWKIYDDAYYNKQHKTGENVKTVKNFIFKIIESEVPVLTDSMAATAITASTESNQEAANNLAKAVKFVQHDQNLPLILPTLVRSALTSAPGYLHACFNPDADGGDGKIEYRQLPWKSIYFDGNAQTIEQAEKCRIEIPMRRDQVARIWPEKREEILKIKASENLESSAEEGLEKRDIAGMTVEMGKPKTYKAKDIVMYSETWVKSYELKDIEKDETDEDIKKENDGFLEKEPAEILKWEDHSSHISGHQALRGQLLAVIGMAADAPYDQVEAKVEELLQQNPQATDIQEGLLIVKMIDNHIEEHNEFKKINPTGQEPKFEDGWRVIKSVEDIILYDGENPDETGEIPIVPFYCYKDDTVYGFGEVKNILNAQQSLNDMDYREFEGLRLNSNSGWIVDHEAEVDESQLTNAPGLVVKKKMGTEVRRAEPGVVSPQLNQRRETDRLTMELLSGMTEATAPEIGASQASGVAIQKIQTQAIGRIRLKDRYLQHYSMKRLAIITAKLILKHWTQEKQMRLRGDNSNIEEFVFNPMEMEELEYTVEISPGSMAGVDKDALNAFYLLLLNSQHITFEEFLLVADFPKKEVLLTSLKERNNQQAQQVAQQAQEQLAAARSQIEASKQETEAHKLENDALKHILTDEEKKRMDGVTREYMIGKINMPEQGQPATNMENTAPDFGQA